MISKIINFPKLDSYEAGRLTQEFDCKERGTKVRTTTMQLKSQKERIKPLRLLSTYGLHNSTRRLNWGRGRRKI